MPSDRSDVDQRRQGTSPHILFVRTDRLGETVLNLPVLHALRTAWPLSRVTLMVNPLLRELFLGHPDLTDVVAEPSFEGSWWSRVWRLSRLWRSWKADVSILSNPKKAYHLAAWFAGIPIRVGYDRKWGRLLTHRVPDRKALNERHEIEANLQLLGALGLTIPAEPVLSLPVSNEARQAVASLLEGLNPHTDLIAVHPWTSNPRKQWPLDRFRALCEQLAAHTNVRVVLIGGSEERAHSAQVLHDQPHLIDLVGHLSLPQLAALLQKARVLVTNDSGPMHVAAAVGTRVVALFGTADPGSHPKRWGPWGKGHRVIHKPLADISVDEVHEAVLRYLA